MLIEYIQRKQMNITDHLVFLTDFVRRQAISWASGLADKSNVIPHPIPQSLSINSLNYNNCPNILVLGRMKEYKGIDMLIEAIGSLQFNRLTIAGGGASQFHCDDQRVKLEEGWLPMTRIHELLSSHEILVLPYKEASQSGVLAMGIAAEMAMVVTRTGGLPEQGTEESILFVEPEPAAIKEGIQKLISDSNFYWDLKRNMRSLKSGTNTIIQGRLEELFHHIQ